MVDRFYGIRNASAARSTTVPASTPSMPERSTFTDAWHGAHDGNSNDDGNDISDGIGAFLPFRPFPAVGDRNAWRGLPKPLRDVHVRHAASHRGRPWPRPLAHDWALFFDTGDRGTYEAMYGAIRRRLSDDLMAYGVQRDDDAAAHVLLADIIDGIMIVCDEAAWQIPAHNTYVRDAPQLPWPDPDRPLLDLFVCDTGQLLASALYLLGDDLPEPIRRRVIHELSRRIVTPYLHDRFWWMGLAGEATNNWTTWCTQNVLATVFLAPFGDDVRGRVIARACASLDAFLRDYGEDGCCTEGAGYYHSAGLCLFGALRILADVRPDVFTPLWRLPKIVNIATYIVRVRVAEDRYFNFSDCSIHAGLLGAREYLFARAVGDDAMARIAAAEWRHGLERELEAAGDDAVGDESVGNPMERINVLYPLFEAGAARAMTALADANDVGDTDDTNALRETRETFFPSTGIAVMRGGGFDVAVRAGANGGSHSHNDTGSVIVWRHGRPVLIDPGVEAYTRQTFSPQRYELWPMQSSWHNLPDFDGVMQRETPDCRAERVHVEFGEDVSRMTADLTHAWPVEAGLRSYVRTVTLRKRADSETEAQGPVSGPVSSAESASSDAENSDGTLTIVDEVSGTFAAASMHLMTAIEPIMNAEPGVPATLRIGEARLEIQGAAGVIGVETKPLDANLAAEWGTPHLWRITIPFTDSLRITVR